MSMYNFSIFLCLILAINLIEEENPTVTPDLPYIHALSFFDVVCIFGNFY